MSRKLFELVKSLDKAEKRTFRLLAGEQQTGYLKLFDTLEKMKEYSDENLSRHFSAQSATALSKTKELLTEHILLSLQHHHRKDDEESILNTLIHIRILMHKGQFELVREKINEVKKKIILLERYFLLGYLLQAEIDLCRNKTLRQLSFQEFDDILHELISVSGKAKNLSEYRQITFNAQHQRVFYGASARVDCYKAYMEKQKANPFFANKNNALSLMALDEYFGFWFWYYEMYKDADKQVEVINEWITEYQKHAHRLPYITGRYMAVLYKLGVAAVAKNDHENFAKAIKQLTEITPDKELQRFERLNYIFSLQLENFYAQRRFEKIVELLPLFNQLTGEYKNRLNDERRVSITKDMAIGYFMSRNYALCVELTGFLMNNFPKIQFSSLCQVRVLNILSHIALENYLLLESLYRSFEHFVKRYSALSEAEKLMRNLIRDLSKTHSQSGVKTVYKSYYEQLKCYAEDNYYFFLPRFLEMALD